MKNITRQDLFSLFGLFWVSLGWLAMLLAFFNIFYVSFLIIFIVLALFFLIFAGIINRKKIMEKKGELTALLFFTLLVSLIFSYFTVPTIFTGRDQGSFSNAAIILSQNHEIKHSFPAEKEFFHIYGPGNALNFPGFNYNEAGELIPHFSLGYIAWLAVFYSFFGLSGFILANAASFCLFLLSFYWLLRNHLRLLPSLIGLSLLSSTFVFSWFFKFTLSENLALALLWFGIAQFLLFLKNPKKMPFLAFLASFGFLVFVRIEFIFFWIIAILILYVRYRQKKISRKNILFRETIIFLFFIISFFLLSLKINSAFYINFFKGFLHSFEISQNSPAPSSTFMQESFYTLKVFLLYGLLPYLIIGLFALFYFLKKKKFFLLIPYFIVLPSLIYLFNPSITLDHPWMLRRFVFALIPAFLFYTLLFLQDFLKKKALFYAICLFLLTANLIVSIPYLSMRENKNLLLETEKISAFFDSNDLLLIDRQATGDPWSMIAGPLNLLYGKQAVYFFNPSDLEKIDHNLFAHIYLIIPDENFEKYTSLSDNLLPVKNYSFELGRLQIFSASKKELLENQLLLPTYTNKYIYGKIYQYKK